MAVDQIADILTPPTDEQRRTIERMIRDRYGDRDGIVETLARARRRRTRELLDRADRIRRRHPDIRRSLAERR